MTLGDKQRLFAKLVPRLIDKAHELGYEVTLGHAFRCQDCHVGAENSNHKKCLAIDLNLFLDKKYLTKTEDHQLLGTWWEQQHALCRWGGRFNDGNHYSLEHEGVK